MGNTPVPTGSDSERLANTSRQWSPHQIAQTREREDPKTQSFVYEAFSELWDMEKRKPGRERWGKCLIGIRESRVSRKEEGPGAGF